MLGRINGAVRFREPLSYHTTLRIGGPAEFFIMPQDLDDLRYALAFAEQEDLPLIVIGGGSNLLVSDRALQGVAVKLQGILSGAEFAGDEVAVGAGMPLTTLIREAAVQGLGGLEYLAGIPATVGGALATNARTAEGAFIKHCLAVYFLHPDGTLGEHRAWGPTGWRTFDLPAPSRRRRARGLLEELERTDEAASERRTAAADHDEGQVLLLGEGESIAEIIEVLRHDKKFRGATDPQRGVEAEGFSEPDRAVDSP